MIYFCVEDRLSLLTGSGALDVSTKDSSLPGLQNHSGIFHTDTPHHPTHHRLTALWSSPDVPCFLLPSLSVVSCDPTPSFPCLSHPLFSRHLHSFPLYLVWFWSYSKKFGDAKKNEEKKRCSFRISRKLVFFGFLPPEWQSYYFPL